MLTHGKCRRAVGQKELIFHLVQGTEASKTSNLNIKTMQPVDSSSDIDTPSIVDGYVRKRDLHGQELVSALSLPLANRKREKGVERHHKTDYKYNT